MMEGLKSIFNLQPFHHFMNLVNDYLFYFFRSAVAEYFH